MHAGDTVRFRIRVTNLGTDVASNVRVCDLLPRGLTLVRSTVKVTYRNGRPCVTIPLLTGQREGFVTMRVARTASGRITIPPRSPAGRRPAHETLRSPSSRPVPRAGV